MARITVDITCSAGFIEHIKLRLSERFSYRITGADSSLETQIIEWLEAYRQNKKLPRLPLKLKTTPFTQKVLEQLQRIPYGETMSYKDVASEIKSGSRAVGNACRVNPYPLVIPCHRVIKADGSLGGYTPDLEIKRRLLVFEGVRLLG